LHQIDAPDGAKFESAVGKLAPSCWPMVDGSWSVSDQVWITDVSSVGVGHGRQARAQRVVELMHGHHKFDTEKAISYTQRGR
jgi:hypothetical protein